MKVDFPEISLTLEDKSQHRDEVFNEIQQSIDSPDSTDAFLRRMLGIIGLLPLTQGLVSYVAGSWGEAEQDRVNKTFMEWLRLQKDQIDEIERTVRELLLRLNLEDEETKSRVESPEYLRLMKKAFRNWSAAESETKREAVRNLLANAASSSLCPDHVLSQFLGWIESFEEMHFAVIKAVYHESQASRADIWEAIGGREDVTDSSSDADFFKFLIDELTRSRIIRQFRQTNNRGEFVKAKPARTRKSSTMISAFEEGKPYVLTELGRQFVHYCLTDVVTKISESSVNV